MDLKFKALNFLNLQIEQYNHNSTAENGKESNSRCLVSSKHEIIPFEEPKDENVHLLKDENKVLMVQLQTHTHTLLIFFPTLTC